MKLEKRGLLIGKKCKKSTFLRIVAAQPVAFGAAIEVPFMSPFLFSVAVGTAVMATPGAQMSTPRAPSRVGPLEDHVYLISGSS